MEKSSKGNEKFDRKLLLGLSEDQHQKLSAIARQQGRSMSSLLREAAIKVYKLPAVQRF